MNDSLVARRHLGYVEITEAPDRILVTLAVIAGLDARDAWIDGDELWLRSGSADDMHHAAPAVVAYQIVGWDAAHAALVALKISDTRQHQEGKEIS